MKNLISTNNIDINNIPKVSIIVPTFNRPQMLLNALNSIATQSYKNFEIIVINDGGEDVTEIINQISCPHITYIRHPENRGMAAARNTGIKFAKGKYISYLDDDDIYYLNHLEILISYLENSDYKVAYTDSNASYKIKKGDSYETIKKEVVYSYDFDPDRFLYRNYIPTLCILHEKACLDEIGFFDESLGTHEDWDLWIRLSRRFIFAHINEITCEYFRSNDYSSTTNLKQIDFEMTKIYIYKKYKHYLFGKPHILREVVYRKKKAKKRVRESKYPYLYYILKVVKSNLIKVRNKLRGINNYDET